MAAQRLTDPQLILRLYIAGSAPNSQRAIANARSICEAHFGSRHVLEIVDLLEHPLRAFADNIIVTPTLLRLAPLPVARVVGSLTDTDKVLQALNGA